MLTLGQRVMVLLVKSVWESKHVDLYQLHSLGIVCFICPHSHPCTLLPPALPTPHPPPSQSWHLLVSWLTCRKSSVRQFNFLICIYVIFCTIWCGFMLLLLDCERMIRTVSPCFFWNNKIKDCFQLFIQVFIELWRSDSVLYCWLNFFVLWKWKFFLFFCFLVLGQAVWLNSSVADKGRFNPDRGVLCGSLKL